MIHGGGRLTRGFVHRFTELAGGKDAPIVAIPTALGGDIDPKRYRERWLERAGFKNITILHTRDPKVADRDEFVAALKKAKGVWLSGGRQWRTADAYLNTKVQAEIQTLYERGGVVAGSSAGATIQGSYLVRGDTRGNRLMMSVGHEQGFGLLPNGAIDQHVIARKRLDDLVPVIERFPYLLGIGIDEGTAVVVQGSTFEVIGESKVAIYDARKWKKSDGEGVETSGGEAAERLRYDFLKPGQRFDWRQRKILEPLSQ